MEDESSLTSITPHPSLLLLVSLSLLSHGKLIKGQRGRKAGKYCRAYIMHLLWRSCISHAVVFCKIISFIHWLSRKSARRGMNSSGGLQKVLRNTDTTDSNHVICHFPGWVLVHTCLPRIVGKHPPSSPAGSALPAASRVQELDSGHS